MPWFNKLLILWLFSFTYYVYSETFYVCSRIYFRGIENTGSKSGVLNHIVKNNIFVKSRWTQNNFPVYKAERQSLYFIYKAKKNKFVFSSSLYGGEYDEPVLSGNKDIIHDKRWQISANNSTLPFGKNIFSGAQNVRPVCVTQHSLSFCGHSQSIYFSFKFNKDSISYNDPALDNFQFLPDLFINNRPVYKHTNFEVTKWYLFFDGVAWRIGPDYNTAEGPFKSDDSASRPELITKEWRQYNGTDWVTIL